ncbi:MAG: hypothetical protein ABIK39_03790 [candidate division WOR-3 bacterium]
MNSIGGYFELELEIKKEYHQNAIRLNLGRCAFEYILRVRKFRKVYLPYYTCEVMLHPIKRLGIEYEFYKIDEDFTPMFDFSLISDKDGFLYTNYFGLMDKAVRKIAKKCKNLIVDNAQAFYSKPIKGIDTFYSPRKFFGVPDGAYLYTKVTLKTNLKRDRSYQRCCHLLRRIDESPESGFSDFHANEKSLNKLPIMQMSNLTQKLLQSINYRKAAKIRRQNYSILHEVLGKYNKLKFDLLPDSIPMVYPFLTSKPNLREYLINNKIYVARYWPNVLEWCDKDNVEYNYAMNIVPLPIDQRYGIKELIPITKAVEKYVKSKR